MLTRLAGLETEYAVRFSPAPRARDDDAPARLDDASPPRDDDDDALDAPTGEMIYDALAGAIGELVYVRPGRRRLLHKQIFTQYGGSFYHEAMPSNIDGGVIEGGTPECRGPSQLLLYQRAQDDLLVRALPLAAERLARLGHPGELGLLKNCRDAFGNIYGAQENYRAEIARGPRLALLRAGLALLAPLACVAVVATWATVLAVLVVGLALIPVAIVLAIVAATVGGLVPPLGRAFSRLGDSAAGQNGERAVMRVFQGIEIALWWPALLPYVWLVRALAFRPARDRAEAFLLSRAVISGAGTLDDDGALHLSEKGVALRRTARVTALPVERVLFDCGNLLKAFTRLAALSPRDFFGLFRRHQRLQLGLSDSNCAQVAEFLKLGTTLLVLDLAEAGALADAPRLVDPVAAHRALIADPSLRTAVATHAHGPMTALQLQRTYLDAARRWLDAHPTPSIEAERVVSAWRDTLDALERDPDSLVGRVDWVTKRWLLGAAAGASDHAVRKKIDLRYHELGVGYFAGLERAGHAPRLVDDDALAVALTTPPEDSPAWTRGRLVARLAQANTPARVSWGEVRVGRGLRGKVIRLDAWRARRDAARDDP